LPALSGKMKELQVEGYSPEDIDYNLALMRERGLIDVASQTNEGLWFKRLTWEGHDYLDAVRDPVIWKKTKAALEKVGSFSFDVAKEFAKKLIQSELDNLL
jgi:Hypothetical protein (DUF2513)